MKFAFAVKYLRVMGSASNDNWGIPPLTLAIACEAVLVAQGPTALRPITHIGFKELTYATLKHLSPTTVVIPLFSQAADAFEMVTTLESFGYMHRIMVIAPALPNPAMVEDELRALGPHQRLTLMST